jgi:hypothetical protein
VERVTVPFSFKRYAEGYLSQVTTRGMVRLDADALVIEFRETSTNLTTLAEESGAVREVRIPIDALESLEVIGGWWSARLSIRTRTLAVLQDVPGATGNECELRIRRRDRTAAREFAVAVSLALSGRELRRLEEGEL